MVLAGYSCYIRYSQLACRLNRNMAEVTKIEIPDSKSWFFKFQSHPVSVQTVDLKERCTLGYMHLCKPPYHICPCSHSIDAVENDDNYSIRAKKSFSITSNNR